MVVQQAQSWRVVDTPVPHLDDYLHAVESRLDSLLEAESTRWCSVDPDMVRGFDLLRSFISNGGKRLRPTVSYWGFIGGGGHPHDAAIVELGAALEMLHTFALVHDDVMDGSAMRRHSPTVHCALIADHERSVWSGEARRFGEGMAILLGDLALVYADHLAASLPPAVRSWFHQMKVELHIGQYLDLLGAAQGTSSLERVMNILRFKTAKYSVERPLHLGFSLATGTPLDDGSHTAQRLSTYGLAVGEAFQLRDDLLGAFGNPGETGKATGDDFRDGKQTLLVLLAAAWLDSGDRGEEAAALFARLGAHDISEDEICALQVLLEECGARAQLEQRIAAVTESAHEILPHLGLNRAAEVALADLADQAAWRMT